MSKIVKEYTAIQSSSIKILIDEVNKKIKEGFQPYHSISTETYTSNSFYTQVMVR